MVCDLEGSGFGSSAMEMLRRRDLPRSSRSGEEQALQRSFDQAERGVTGLASHLSESGTQSMREGAEAVRNTGGEPEQCLEAVRTPQAGSQPVVNPFWSPAARAEAELQHACT